MVNRVTAKTKHLPCLDVHRWTEQILDNPSSNNSGIAVESGQFSFPAVRHAYVLITV